MINTGTLMIISCTDRNLESKVTQPRENSENAIIRAKSLLGQIDDYFEDTLNKGFYEMKHNPLANRQSQKYYLLKKAYRVTNKNNLINTLSFSIIFTPFFAWLNGILSLFQTRKILRLLKKLLKVDYKDDVLIFDLIKCAKKIQKFNFFIILLGVISFFLGVVSAMIFFNDNCVEIFADEKQRIAIFIFLFSCGIVAKPLAAARSNRGKIKDGISILKIRSRKAILMQ